MALADRVVRQRSGGDRGQRDDERFAGSGRAGDTGAGCEDRADVAGPVTAEGDGPFERGDHGVAAVGRFEGGELVEIAGQLLLPAAAAALMNATAAGPSAQNAISAGVLGRTARAGVAGRGPP